MRQWSTEATLGLLAAGEEGGRVYRVLATAWCLEIQGCNPEGARESLYVRHLYCTGMLYLREVPGKNGVLCGFKLENTYLPLLNDPQDPLLRRGHVSLSFLFPLTQDSYL